MVALHCGKIFFSKIKKEIVETPGPGMPALELWVQPPGKGASLCSFQSLREGSCFQIGLFFEKVPRGGGLIFNPKIYIADF